MATMAMATALYFVLWPLMATCILHKTTISCTKLQLVTLDECQKISRQGHNITMYSPSKLHNCVTDNPIVFNCLPVTYFNMWLQAKINWINIAPILVFPQVTDVADNNADNRFQTTSRHRSFAQTNRQISNGQKWLKLLCESCKPTVGTLVQNYCSATHWHLRFISAFHDSGCFWRLSHCILSLICIETVLYVYLRRTAMVCN